MKKKNILAPAAGAVIYLLLLFLLVLAERGAGSSAQIRNIGDAFWYSLITLTTVGYGDLYPVTAAGRIIGGAFSLLSLGGLAVLIGLLVSAMRGGLLPFLKLYLGRERSWILFCGEPDLIRAAAENCSAEYPDALLILPSNVPLGKMKNTVRIDRDAADILGMRPAKGGKDSPPVFFALSENEADNIRAASELSEKDCTCRICCRVSGGSALVPSGVIPFDEEQVVSRLFWRKHGLKREEKNIVLIGPPMETDVFLCRTLLVNVLGPDQCITYHVFCENDDFLQYHSMLGDAEQTQEGCSIRLADGSGDTVRFYRDPWYSKRNVLQEADRIILCGGDTAANLRILEQLVTLYGVQGTVYVRSSSLRESRPDGQRVILYGAQETVYSPEMMLRGKLNEAAKALHEVYTEQTGGKGPAFEDLGWFQKESNIAAADHMLCKLRILLGREDVTELTEENCRRAMDVFRESRRDPVFFQTLLKTEHIRWMRFHMMYNWKYDAVRNDLLRHHPLLIPYEKLSFDDRLKNAPAWEVIGDMPHVLDRTL